MATRSQSMWSPGALALLGLLAAVQASALDQSAPWRGYSGKLENVEIILVRHSGYGGFAGPDSLVISGNGRATLVRRKFVGPQSRPEVSRQSANIPAEAFVELVNRFYEVRYFQLDSTYTDGAWMHLEDSNRVQVYGMSISDAGKVELTMRLGKFQKRIEFIPMPQYCPAYVLGLMGSVEEFSRTIGLK
jgi:hypothetical protein